MVIRIEQFGKKIKIHLPKWPRNLIPERTKHVTDPAPPPPTKTCTRIFRAALFIIAPNKNNPNAYQLVNKLWLCPYNEQYSAIKELLTHAKTWVNLKSIKWKNPDRTQYILYNSIYMKY